MWTVLILVIGTVLGIGLVRVAERNGTPGREMAAARLDQPAFGPIVERSLPAVVSIDVERRFRHRDLGLDEESWEELDPRVRDQELEIPATGSGFVIDPAGMIL
ncbi:MAG: hypothetical protein GF346_08260, partial [Candidatus Eisenbacteria bacterium]|nr:hypothetical protein [Candidatus Latescibacterota bacterium]MBD3302426.1 hypothetical protein [Candidatus Eisenbacteria bacterium]